MAAPCDPHTLACIIKQLEEDNRFLRQELKSVRAELERYKQKPPLNIDEKIVEQMLSELLYQKTEENTKIEQMTYLQTEANHNDEPVSNTFIWDEMDHYLRMHQTNYIKDIITKHDIDPNQTDDRHQQMTLLMKSCVFGNYDVAELLVHCDVDIYLESEMKDNTALSYAETWANYHIAQLLQLQDLSASLGSEVKHKIKTLHRQNGITQCAVQRLSEQTLDEIVGLMWHCVEHKLPFSDAMMHIAWEHINNRYKKENKHGTDSKLFQLLLETYSKIVKDTANKRDWSWLEHYLLPSTLWLNTYPHDDTRTLFNELFVVADAANQNLSKNVLLSSIREMKKEHLELWRKLKRFQVQKCVNPKGINRGSTVRQDGISCGVKADYTMKELLRNKPYKADFNPLQHYDLNEYLNKLYLRATIVDEHFQNDVFRIMTHIVSEDESIAVHYKRGPIKLFKRCVAKIEDKYMMREEFPTAAHLLDIIRCTLSFDDLPSMMKGIQRFIEIVHEESSCIKKIVRCKNMWNSTDFTDSNPKYSDIKFNVVIDIGNDIAIIGEIQILLSLMERFKSSAHQYYNIFRHHDFIQNYIDIAPFMMDKQTQLFTYACNGDSKSLLHFMVTYNISPNDLLIPHQKSGKSILSKICDFDHIKMFKLLQTLLSPQQFTDALALCDTTDEQWSPAGEALNANSEQIIRLLCKQYPQLMLDFHFPDKMGGKHALHLLCENGNIEGVKWYLERVRYKTYEEKKQTLLIRDKYGCIPFVSACNYGQIPIIEYMMEWSANENLQHAMVMSKDDDESHSALQLCCYKGNDDVLMRLLSYVINYELRLKMILDEDCKGRTPLIYAALSENDSAADCVDILLRNINDDVLRLKYMKHKEFYNNETAYQHTANENVKRKLLEWVSNSEK